MWLQGPLFQTLYTDSSTSGAIDTQSRPGFIGGVNKVVGGVRIGQNRVLPRDCSESSKLVSKFVFTQTEYPMRCYGDSSGGYGFKLLGVTAWVHTPLAAVTLMRRNPRYRSVQLDRPHLLFLSGLALARKMRRWMMSELA